MIIATAEGDRTGKVPGTPLRLGRICRHNCPVITFTGRVLDHIAGPSANFQCAIKPPPTVLSSAEQDPTIANAIMKRNIPRARLQNLSLTCASRSLLLST